MLNNQILHTLELRVNTHAIQILNRSLANKVWLRSIINIYNTDNYLLNHLLSYKLSSIINIQLVFSTRLE